MRLARLTDLWLDGLVLLAALAARDELAAHGLHARLTGWQPQAGATGRIAVAVPRREYALARGLVHPRTAAGT